MFLSSFVEPFGQRFVTSLVFELALMIKNRLRKAFPDFVAHGLSRKLACGFFEILPEFVISFRTTGETDDDHGRRQVAVGREVSKRGEEFAMGAGHPLRRRSQSCMAADGDARDKPSRSGLGCGCSLTRSWPQNGAFR